MTTDHRCVTSLPNRVDNNAADGCPVNMFRAQYFSNTEWSGRPVRTTCELMPNVQWGAGGPHGLSGAFSVRWTGTIDFEPGVYELSTGSPVGGSKISVDGVLVLPCYPSDFEPCTTSRLVDLSGGRLHAIVYEVAGVAYAALSWCGVAMGAALHACSNRSWFCMQSPPANSSECTQPPSPSPPPPAVRPPPSPPPPSPSPPPPSPSPPPPSPSPPPPRPSPPPPTNKLGGRRMAEANVVEDDETKREVKSRALVAAKREMARDSEDA